MIARYLVAICVAIFPGLAVATEQPLEVREVVAHGVGTSPEGAAQNAAENALREVVGAFINSQQAIDKRAQITDGIRSETKVISSKTAQYSQGAIKSFELIDVKQQNGLYEANAKVAVRVEDFKVYIRKVAEADTAVDMGEITAMATDLKQRASGNELLIDPISKIVRGEVVKLELGKPVRLSGYIDEIKASGTPEEKQHLRIATNGFDVTTTIAIPIISSIDRAFLANLAQQLSSTASEKKVDTGDRQYSTNEFQLQLGPVKGSGGASNPLFDFFTLPVTDAKALLALTIPALRIEVKGAEDVVLESYKLPGPKYPNDDMAWAVPGAKVTARDYYNSFFATSHPFAPGLVHVHNWMSADARGRLLVLVDRKGVIFLQLKPEIIPNVKGFNVKYDA